ncbi:MULTISPECIES: pro-sigmaK processing inhibitor BofA family protein [Sporomusa]|jgi:inhibitor of the pro-sigma K processing machinery|uniref:SigmaK-factor processing regulatory protein BofA n=1 Tax=Sporomusa silvacetica DSM 10669 TaxID=1123289 RepID=A0ABZ3IUK6_9FIRM|nr:MULTISPECIES: pro-sigmaK processing inhibitor BofA family protein [Sporomusa]OZC19577.1 sigmaK-factor processing regulatory protein BofA [Sporomusa silvacetica DSM 10669]TWH46156.1 inhibitor of the pro-sigma K processing machinery [Sporomusa sp. KB1]
MEFLPVALEFNVIIAYAFGIILIYLIGRMLTMPIRIVLKLIYNGLVGGIVLWVVNFIGAYFSFTIGINPITALIAGFLGIPGVILLILFKLFIN